MHSLGVALSVLLLLNFILLNHTRTINNRNFLYGHRSLRIFYDTSSFLNQHEIGHSSLNITYKIHDGFTAREIDIINRAMKVVENRLTKPHVRDCVYRKTGNIDYYLANGVWDRSNLKADDNYDGQKDLLRFQLMCIEALGVKKKLPTIHIKPFYNETPMVARGEIGCVTFSLRGTQFAYDGEFDVKLNRHQINAATRNGGDTEFWAGTIVHEMLHNLGHDHKDYTDKWQINAFEHCLAHDGKYKKYDWKYVLFF